METYVLIRIEKSFDWCKVSNVQSFALPQSIMEIIKQRAEIFFDCGYTVTKGSDYFMDKKLNEQKLFEDLGRTNGIRIRFWCGENSDYRPEYYEFLIKKTTVQ